MYFAHEFMKMHTSFAHDRHDRVEAVHQKGFAAPHTSPHVDTTWNIGATEQALELVRSLGLVRDPFVIRLLQALYCPALRFIGLIAALGKRMLIELPDIH